MRRIALFTALLLAGFAHASDRPPPPDAEARFQRLVTLLDLTTEQQPTVKAILDAGHQRRDAIEGATREEHDALRSQVHAQLAEVLTDTQLQRFDALMAERRPGPPRGEEHGPGRRAE